MGPPQGSGWVAARVIYPALFRKRLREKLGVSDCNGGSPKWLAPLDADTGPEVDPGAGIMRWDTKLSRLVLGDRRFRHAHWLSPGLISWNDLTIS
jgi:hypothetical protein